MVASVGGLVGVVDLDQVVCAVGVQDGGIGILRRPDDSILILVGGNAGSGSGIGEGVNGLRSGLGQELGVLELKGEDGLADRAVVEPAIEIGRGGPDAAGQGSDELLIDFVAAGSEFPHGSAVDEIEIGILTGARG